MSVLYRLSIANLRNINSADIYPTKYFNILFGDNGSGKSSALESIYLLGLAKSFRGSTSQRPVIQSEQNSCTVFGELASGVSLGITKTIRGPNQIKISGSMTTSTAELARLLPIQLINSDTFKVLEGSPHKRRQFLDWGVFHVEPLFIDKWRKSQKALKNRNVLLKSQANINELEPWTRELAIYAEEVDRFRSKYFELLLPVFSSVIYEFLPEFEFSVEYQRGWNEENDLLTALSESLSRDTKFGYTVLGPHRADIKFKINGLNAIDILSRGQQKLLVSALKVSQGVLLEQLTNKQCVFIIDDLPSELDINNRIKLCNQLKKMKVQVFLSCVEKSSLYNCFIEDEFLKNENKLFHVKHGKISATETLF